MSHTGVTGKSTDGVIDALLKAQDRLQIAEDTLKNIEQTILDGSAVDDSDFVDRERALKAVEETKKQVAKHTNALGTNLVEALTLAANKDYFNVRRQARAKRELWMKRLIDRHRELANIERPHMSEINSEELFTYK